MNTYTFHITPYDLVGLGAIFIGLTFTLLLWFTKRINRTANRFLAIALSTFVLQMLWIVGIDISPETNFPHWSWLAPHFSLAIGPLIYFYVLIRTSSAYKFRWKYLLHFSPALLDLGFLLLEIKESIRTCAATYNTMIYKQLNPVSQLLAVISVIIYLYLCRRLIRIYHWRMKANLVDRSRYGLRWLRRLLTGFGRLWLLWIPFIAVDFFYYHSHLAVHAYYPLYLLLAVMMIWIAAAAYLSPDVDAPVLAPPVSKPPAELMQNGVWLRKAMEADRFYQDTELSLGSLAEALAMHPLELSRIINVALKKNFNDFINEYRIREVTRKMQDPAYDRLTLLGIALDAGFNSKSTFNRTFRQMTGKSPAEYKNRLKKERPTYFLRPYSRSAAVISYQEATPRWSSEKLNRTHMIKNYVKIALRGFWRHKLFTLINIIGLSIGISAALVIYLIVHFDFTFDKFHKDGDRIYRVVTNYSFSGTLGYNAGVCGPLSGAIKGQVSGLAETAPILRLGQPNVFIPENAARSPLFKNTENIIFADQNYFDIFQYKWLAGSEKTALNVPGQVVLTSAQAEKYFPNVPYDQMLGRTVMYDTLRTTVTGIVQTMKANTDLVFQDFISYATALSNPKLKSQLRLRNWGGTKPTLQLFVKLSPQTSPGHIEQQLNTIFIRNNPQTAANKGTVQKFHLQPLADIHFNADYGTFNGRIANKTTLYELLAIALFLLLLGCINFVNLTTAQLAQRAKEIGIRKTLGSNRRQLVFQFLSETFLITLIAVIISAALTPFILQLFAGFIPAEVTGALVLQPNILLFLALLTVVVSLFSGFYPALVLSGYKPVAVLKNQAQGSSSKTRNAFLRKSLTVTQFVIAQFFIMATVLVSKQIHYALNKDLGFKKDAVIIINSPEKNRQAGHNLVFINKLQSIPQVEMVSEGRDAPISDNTNTTEASYNDGKKEIKIENLSEKFGDANYIKLYHIRLLAGRNLQPADTGKVFLINNLLAKRIGFNDPHDAVGKTIDNFNGDTKMTIIGVISDFHQESIQVPIAPLVLMTSTDPGNNGTFHIALKPQTASGNEWKRAIAGMEAAWKESYPGEDFEYHFFDENIARLYTSEQRTSTLLSWATGLSILISCLGLLGLAIYTTSQRTKEIGVRKVLGASVVQVVALLSSEMMVLILIAFVIVSPFAYYSMHQWIENFADRTTVSWWIFAVSGSVMLFTAFFTSAFQTIKAALANPVKSLRSE